MVAHEVHSGKKIRLWKNELYALPAASFDVGDDSLFVAYYASAEMGCFLSLHWPFPANVLDLFTEFRCLINGSKSDQSASLLSALRYFGIESIDAAEKDAMRDLAMRGGEYTDTEKSELLDYCESDVVALDKLLQAMGNTIDLPRALLRGKFMAYAAIIEHNGIPVDVEHLALLRAHWVEMQDKLINTIDATYGVYEGKTFKTDKFEDYLRTNNIAWPRSVTGKLDLQDDTFKDMAQIHPQLTPLRELRASLSQMRLADFSVGTDGRNRCLLSAFRSKTSRNQPSNSKFMFGPAVWLRGLMQSQSGHGIAYIDWSQQEFGIAAALSNDPLMKLAYSSGDPYLEFAKQAGAVPQDATKKSHKAERERFKACVLAVQYGMGAESLSRRINRPPLEAQELLNLHRRTYRVFWKWSDDIVNYAALYGCIHTVFGWTLHVTSDTKERTIRNFPMQANGAEMLRLACIYGIDAGIKICAPVHDAILIEAPAELLNQHIATMQEAMCEASRVVLDDFELRSGVEIFCYPDRYSDERGIVMWNLVQKVLNEMGVT